MPEILRGGNHALINSWRLKQSLKATYFVRPDLLNAEQLQYIEGKLPYKMKKAERKFYEELRAEIAAAKEKILCEQSNEGDEEHG